MWEKRYEPKSGTAHVGEYSPKWTYLNFAFKGAFNLGDVIKENKMKQ